MPRITTPTTLPLRRDEDASPRALPVAPDVWAILEGDRPRAFLRVTRSLVDGGIERVTIIHPGQRAGVGGGETTDVLAMARIAQRAFPNAQVSLLALDRSDKPRNSLSELEAALGGLTEVGDMRLRDARGRSVIDGRYDAELIPDLTRQMNSIAEEFVRTQDVVITGGAYNGGRGAAIPTEMPGVPRGRTNLFVRELNAPQGPTRTPLRSFTFDENGDLMRQLNPGVRSAYGDPAMRTRAAELTGEGALPARTALLARMLNPQLAAQLAGDRWAAAYLPNIPERSMGMQESIDAFVRSVVAQPGDGRNKTVFVFSTDAYDALREAFAERGIAVDDLRAGAPQSLPPRNNVRVVVVPRQPPEVFQGVVAGSELPSLVTGTNSFLDALSSGKPFLYHAMDFKVEMIQEYVELAREVLSQNGVPEERIQRFTDMFPQFDTAAEQTYLDENYPAFREDFMRWRARQGAELNMPGTPTRFPFFLTENTRRVREAMGNPMSEADVEAMLRETYVRSRRIESPFGRAANAASAEALFGGDAAEVGRMFQLVSDRAAESSFERELTQTALRDFRTAQLMRLLETMPSAERAQWMDLLAAKNIPGADTFALALRTGATPVQIRDAALLYDRPEFRDAVNARLNEMRPTLGQAVRVAGPKIGGSMLALLAAEKALDAIGIQDRGARLLATFPLAHYANQGIERVGRGLAQRYNILGLGERAAAASMSTAERAATSRPLRPAVRGLTVALAQGSFSNAVATQVMDLLGVDPRSFGYRATAFTSMFAPDLARVGLSTAAPQSAAVRAAGVAGRAAFWIGMLKLVDEAGGIAWDWSSSTAAYDRMVGARARELKSDALARDRNIGVRALIGAADFLANAFGRNATAAFQQQNWRDVAALELQNDARSTELELGRVLVRMMAEVGKAGVAAPFEELKKRIAADGQLKEAIDFLRLTAPSGHGSRLPEIFGAGGVDEAKLEQYLRGLRGAPPRAQELQAAMEELGRVEREVRLKLPGLSASAEVENTAAQLEALGTEEGRALAGRLRIAVLRASSVAYGYERGAAVDAMFPIANPVPPVPSTRPSYASSKPLSRQTLSEIVAGITDALAGSSEGPKPKPSIGWVNAEDRTQGVRVQLNRMTFVFKHVNGQWVIDSVGGRRSVLKEGAGEGRPEIESRPIPPGANLRELIDAEIETQRAMDAWRAEEKAKEAKAAETPAVVVDPKEAAARALEQARAERAALEKNIRDFEARERELSSGGRTSPVALRDLIARSKGELETLDAKIARMEEEQGSSAAGAPAADAPAASSGAASSGATDSASSGATDSASTDPAEKAKAVLAAAEAKLDALEEELDALIEGDASEEAIAKKQRELEAARTAVDEANRAWELSLEPAPAPQTEPAPAPQTEPAPAPQTQPAPAPQTQPAPAAIAPVQAAPVQAAPVQAAPVQAAPVQAAPAAVAPVQAAPVDEQAAVLAQLNAELAQRIAIAAAPQPAPATPVQPAPATPVQPAPAIERSHAIALPQAAVLATARTAPAASLPSIEAGRQAAQTRYQNQFVQNRNLEAARTGVTPASTAGSVASPTHGVLA